MNKPIAVALRYDESLPAPFITASGRGDLAARLSDIAERAGVPIIEDPTLAERLICLDPGTVIPEELFPPVAAVISFILSLEAPQG
jgi:flagellar biosynthesis protein